MKLTICALMSLSLAACGGGSASSDSATATASYTIGGSVTGLNASEQLVLLNSGGNALTITANAPYKFTMPVVSGSSYAVTVGTQPLGQTCSVVNGSAAAITANVSNVDVSCVTSTETPLYALNGTTDGGGSYTGLTQGTDGSFYGGTSATGGTIFKITPTGSSYTYTLLYTLNGSTDGDGVASRLLLGADGNFYGTTYANTGSTGGGTIFRLSKSGTSYVYTVLYTLNGTTDGDDPEGNLIQGPDGSLYGMTSIKGDSAANGGTVFKLTPSGSTYAFSVIYSFKGGADGCFPAGGLTLGADGNLYGTTLGCGTGAGTIYKLSLSGSSYVHTVLHAMNGTTDGVYPQSALVQGSDGNFYGTTSGGGVASSGPNTIFSISPTGTYTVLYTLNRTTDGLYPFAGLVLGSDGSFYGTTSQGGSSTANAGTIYKLTPGATGATYSVLYTLNGTSDGSNPYGGLTLGTDGHFYGITANGGASNAGVIFRF